MLRIHFTENDLVRTSLASTPDPLWETVLSLQMLRARYGAVIFNGWRRRVREAARGSGQTNVVKDILFPLTPDSSYFPDFLTPPEGLLGMDTGIETILATSGDRIRHEVQRLRFPAAPPSSVARLAVGDRESRRELTRALLAYHRVAIAPYWNDMKAGAESNRARRSPYQRVGGISNVLAGFWPMMRWQPPVLEMSYPVRMDLHLRGRGLMFIPSYFCWHHPVALADPALPPTIVYPLRPTADFLDCHPATSANPALAKLIGSTRARVLAAAAEGANTSELACRTGVSMTTASQHAAVLREAGLIESNRDANAVIHTLTALGVALLTRRKVK